MVNFCLRESDTALSIPSRSKILNFVTNEVFKALVIGYEPLINETLSKFDFYREQVEFTPCNLVAKENVIGNEAVGSKNESMSNVVLLVNSNASLPSSPSKRSIICTEDALVARIYIDWLYDLLASGITHESILGGIYDRGYKRLLTTLKDAGCRFREKKIPAPTDSNICLSLLDVNNDETYQSRTKSLNKLSNSVSRAMLYGTRTDKEMMANSIDSIIPEFASRWNIVSSDAQELLYLKALAVLLRDGLQAAEISITFVENSSNSIGVSNVSGKIDDISLKIPPLRLFDVYQNAFQRVVEKCLTEIGMRAGSNVPQVLHMQFTSNIF
jgi:hypothetical protein